MVVAWRRQRLITARQRRGGRTKDTSVYEERRDESERRERRRARDCERRETGEIRLDGSRTEDATKDIRYEI